MSDNETCVCVQTLAEAAVWSRVSLAGSVGSVGRHLR